MEWIPGAVTGVCLGLAWAMAWRARYWARVAVAAERRAQLAQGRALVAATTATLAAAEVVMGEGATRDMAAGLAAGLGACEAPHAPGQWCPGCRPDLAHLARPADPGSPVTALLAAGCQGRCRDARCPRCFPAPA